ncbi:hypothetical protein SLS53_009031 [Cytospora paraplurivora]|uniref:Uncharacterized protein n=1 Tax=Cytospora paraplurivora TaxID=2898453 RepID=A0AAN9TW55_9PEZI
MPSPWSTSFQRRNATSEEGSKDTKRALDLGPWEPQSFAFSNRLGNASRSGKVTLHCAPSSRKRPANYEPQNEANKSYKTSTTGTPQTSPSTSKTTVKDQTSIAKNTRVVIDLTDDSDALSLPTPSVGPDQYTLGSPPRKIIRPSPISRRGIQTETGPAANNKFTLIDLTGDDDEDSNSPISLAQPSNDPHLLIDCTADAVFSSSTAHRSTKGRLDNVPKYDDSPRSSTYRHDNTPKGQGLTKVDISTDSPLSFTDGSAVAGKQVEKSHRGRFRSSRAPHYTGSPYMQIPTTSRASPASPAGTSLSSRPAESSLLFAKREDSTGPTTVSTLRKKHAQAYKLDDEARKRVQKVTNAQAPSTTSRARTPPKSLAQINHKYSVALARSVRSATQTQAPTINTALGRLKISQGDAFSHAVAVFRSGTQKREPMGAKDDHDEVFASPGTQWLPTLASLSPAQGVKSDRSIVTDASNADEGPKDPSHPAETPRTVTAAAIAKLKITPEPEGSEVSAELAQLQDLGIASDEEHAAGDDDDGSDEKYVPATPPGRSHKRPSPCKTPRTPRPSMVVVLRAPPEKLFHISLRPERVAEIPIEGKCFLLTLPLEVRKRIWRHLLLAPRPIQVMNGWSQLCRWQQLDLHPAVLAVSRAAFDEAARVLYAENGFRYLVRDKACVPGRGGRGRGRGRGHCRQRRTRGGALSNPCAIDVAKYGRYFRRLELRMERNRMTAEYDGVLARALDILLDVGVELHRLTIDVSPRPQIGGDDDDDDDTEDETTASMSDWFHPEGEVHDALTALDTSFIHIHVFTPETDAHASRGLRCIIDKRREVSELEVLQACDQQRRGAGGADVVQPGDIISREDMRRYIQTRQAKTANRRLSRLHLRIESACRDPEAAVRKGWFEPFEATREWRGERFATEPRAYPGGEADDSGDEDYSD